MKSTTATLPLLSFLRVLLLLSSVVDIVVQSSQVVQVQAFCTATAPSASAAAAATPAARRTRRGAAGHCNCGYCSVSSTASSTTRLVGTAASSNSNNMSDESTTTSSGSLQFGKFTISPSQIFYTSPTHLSAAIVNLRPIVPGHVLVISTRVVPQLSQLTEEQYTDLWRTVRRVQTMLARKYVATANDDDDDNSNDASAAAFNVAVQDGRNAGQSVPHVHVHILPRTRGDFDRNDDVYDELEAWAPTIKDAEVKRQQQEKEARKLEVLDDADRRDRTMEQMEKEAEEYRRLMV